MLAGRYRLEDRVQATPDGSLWRAVDETLDRQVTVRVMRPSHPFAADAADAARRAVLIEDPRLVRVLDVGVETDVVFIVCEYFAGETLTPVLRRSPLPPDEVRRVLGEVGQALERAGLRGLHHLRLRPDHVMIRPDGTVKVFGLAVEAAAQGLDVNPQASSSRVDAVALAALAYAGLTGRWPIEESSGLELAPRQGIDPVGVEVLAPDTPADLVKLCHDMLGQYDAGPRSPGELVARIGSWDTPARSTPQARELPLRPQPETMEVSTFDRLTQGEGRPATGNGRPAEPRHPATDPRHPAGEPPHPPQEPARTLGPDETGTGLPTLLPYGNGPGNGSGSRPGSGSGTGPGGGNGARPAASAPATAAPSAPASTRQLHPAEQTRIPGPSGPHPLTLGEGVPRPAAATPGQSSARTSASAPAPAGPYPAAPAPGPEYPATQYPPSGPPANLPQDPAAAPDILLPWPSSWPGTRNPGAEPNLGPFPLAPVADAPTQKQSRGVIFAVVGVLVLVLVFAVWSLKGLAPDTGAFGPGPTFTPIPIKPSERGTGANPNPAAAARPEVKGAISIDPEGDKTEHPESVGRAFDGDPDTSWRTEQYQSDLGAVGKSGVGLVIDLGRPTTVRDVTVDTPSRSGRLELRTTNDPEKPGTTVLASSDIGADGAVLTPKAGTVVQRYLVVWCTELPQESNGQWRLDLAEISVR